MHRFGLIGFPLTHSFSQQYFTEKFQQLGLRDHVYENYSFEDIQELSSVIAQYPDLEGFNITIPHKKAIIPFLHAQSEVVKSIGACNCVQIRDGRLIGYNTDVIGFEQSLQPFIKPWHKKALILGTGGASAAVEYVLQKMGIAYQFVSRNATGNQLKYEEADEVVFSTHHLIINTTPLGMYPNTANCPELNYALLSPMHHLYDLIYNPTETLFLKKGKEQGATIQNGKEMLVLQAAESWRIWNS
ncbi:MAG: hypothetical protein RLZZ28_2453 [Bacteroidota bacterium]|jgi:shikimate dehydrogenase